jgi:hypothetical protein
MMRRQGAAMALQDKPDFQPRLRSGRKQCNAGRLEQPNKTVGRLWQLNPALQVSNLTDMLGPFNMPKTSRDRKDCGKPGT